MVILLVLLCQDLGAVTRHWSCIAAIIVRFLIPLVVCDLSLSLALRFLDSFYLVFQLNLVY